MSSSTLHILPSTPTLPHTLTSTLGTLSPLTKQTLSSILKFTFDALLRDMSDSGESDIEKDLGEYLKENDVNETLETMLPLAKALLFVFKSTIQHSLTVQQLESDLKTLGVSQQYAVLISKAFFQHVREALLERYDESVPSFNVNGVRDLEWRFGVTVSSSEMARIGKPYVQMKMTVGERVVAMEMRVEQFYEFLHEMEKAKALGDMMSG